MLTKNWKCPCNIFWSVLQISQAWWHFLQSIYFTEQLVRCPGFYPHKLLQPSPYTASSSPNDILALYLQHLSIYKCVVSTTMSPVYLLAPQLSWGPIDKSNAMSTILALSLHTQHILGCACLLVALSSCSDGAAVGIQNFCHTHLHCGIRLLVWVGIAVSSLK